MGNVTRATQEKYGLSGVRLAEGLSDEDGAQEGQNGTSKIF